MIVCGSRAVFCVDNAESILECVPDAKAAEKNGKTYVSVPHDVNHMQVMQNFGLEVSSPILYNYDWPIRPGWQPRWYQRDTAAHFVLNRRDHCHNSMRTGKTLATLWAIDYLQKQGLIQKALIVAPLSSLELAWADNIYFNFPRKKYAVLHTSAPKRKELLKQDHDIYIVNHDGVGIILDDLMKRSDINCVVIDEAHEYKNQKTQKWKALNEFVNKSKKVEWCWGLTGTPVCQSPVDAFGQSKMITPEKYNGSFTRFKMDTMVRLSQFRWIPRTNSEQLVKQVLSPSIRFGRDVVTDMEPCLIERHAELSHEQLIHYNKLRREAVTEISGTTVTAVNAAIVVQKLVQCACGCIYGQNGEFLHIDFGPRLKVLEELIEQNDEKVLVFVPFTGALDAVAAELKKRWTVAVVDGGVSAGKRDQIFRDFQSKPAPHIIVAHPGTMAYSLDLCAASLIIWYAPPAGGNKIYQQACARIDGANQKVKIDIAHISGTKEERKAYDVVQGKGKWQDILLNLMEKGR